MIVIVMVVNFCVQECQFIVLSLFPLVNFIDSSIEFEDGLDHCGRDVSAESMKV